MTAAIRIQLEDHRRQLRRVVAENAFVCTTNNARKWLARVESALRQNDLQLAIGAGLWGGNGYAPLIQSIIDEHEFHRAAQARKVAA